MKQYDAYLFDWDGTVAQSLSFWLKLVQETLVRYGIAATDKEIVRKVLGRARAGLLELGVPATELADVFARWDDIAQQQMPLVPLYQEAEKTLQTLAGRHKKLAVITATVRPTMQTVLDKHNLHSTFAVVVTGDEVKAHKPDPEGILFVLNRLDVPKDRAVMMGDSEKDILAANNAGVDSILFYPPEHKTFHTRAQLQADKPTYTISSWRQLVDGLQ